MINERIASLILSLPINLKENKFLKKYYSLGLNFLIRELKSVGGIDVIYLKGSINTSDFEFGVSDLDFIIIGSDISTKNKIIKIFKEKNRLFPFIKDFDFYTKNEFSYLLSFGGIKFLANKDWMLLSGIDIRQSNYVYFPFKFFADQLYELYFLLVWLNKNLELMKSFSSIYRIKNIERTIKKIFVIVKWIENPQTFNKPSFETLDQSDVDYIGSIIAVSEPQMIVEKLHEYLSSKKLFEEYYNKLPFKFDWLEENFEIEDCEEYMKYISKSSHNFVIPKGSKYSIDYMTDDIVIPESLFKLFHKLGCIDDEVLLMNASNNDNNLLGLFSLAQSYGRNIDSSIHKKYKNLLNKTELYRELNNRYQINISKPISFLNKTTFVTVNWGFDNDRFKAMLNAKKKLSIQEGSFEFLHIDLSINKLNNNKFFEVLGFNVLSIMGDSDNEKLWHKEALYNLAALFAFQSENYIFTDADVYSNDDHWLLKIETLLNKGFDFVHGFSSVVDTIDEKYQFDSWTKKFLEKKKSHVAPGLVWGIKNSTLKEIEFLPDSLPDGSCDGAFIQEMTGTEMGFVNNFKWYRSKIRKHSSTFKVTYCPVEVIHINHGISRDYDNRGVLLDLVKFDFLEAYNKDPFGIYKWSTSDPSKKSAILLKNLYYELEPNEFMYLLDNLKDQDFLNFPSTFKFIAEDNINNELTTTNGVSILYQLNKKGSYKIVTSSNNSKKSTIRLRYGGFDMMDNEYIHFKFDINNQGDHFEGSINYNWWKLFGANDLNYKFFQNRVKQTIELVPSSWQDHVPMFVDLNVNKPTPGRTYFVEKLNQEHINMHHAWDGLENFIVDLNEVDIKSNVALINLKSSSNYKNGWYRIEYFFEDTPDQGIKVSVVAGCRDVPITATRKLNNCNVPYKRIIFYKNHYTSNIKFFLKFIDSKSVNFGKLRVVVLSRRNLK